MSSHISSKTLRRFFEASPIPLVLASPVFDDCPLILVNDPFLDLTGYTRDEVLGRNCRFLQGPESEPEAREALRTALDQQQEAVVSISNYRKDGTRFRNLIFLFPIFDAQQKFLYMLGSQCDISASNQTLPLDEHARLLGRTLELNNPLLVHRDNLQIASSGPCMRTIGRYLSATDRA